MKISAPPALVSALTAAAFSTMLTAFSQACAQSPSASSPNAQPASSGPRQAAAQVDGETITVGEVEKALGPNLDRLEQQIYEMKLQQIDRMVADKLLAREAARRSMSVDALVAAEIDAKVQPVTDQEVEQFYEANRSRLPQRDDIKVQIRQYLRDQRASQRRDEYLGSLRSAANVVVNLTPPPVTRASVSIDGAPYRGNADAPVTIVEFSDFHCPFCRRVKPTLAQLLAKYPEKIKLVYRDLPLDSLHPTARAAAEAARCAQEQGQFWPYHDKLYERDPDASPEALKGVAKEVGLNLSVFEQCVASGKFRTAVQASVDEAERLGATGTPAFFINGRLVSGALPLETFERMINEELAGSVRTR
jgi:protein-disulfide isomerase